jgi:hypothetical protein
MAFWKANYKASKNITWSLFKLSGLFKRLFFSSLKRTYQACSGDLIKT